MVRVCRPNMILITRPLPSLSVSNYHGLFEVFCTEKALQKRTDIKANEYSVVCEFAGMIFSGPGKLITANTMGTSTATRWQTGKYLHREPRQWMRMCWKKIFLFESEISLNLPHCFSFVICDAQNGEYRRFGRLRSDACDRWYYRETRVEASRRPCSNRSDAEQIFTQ